ncbi:MAG: hypothetical protein F7B18_05120, partial [Desulfurococcales archaeon]|nr:hypothetical protein [Desulfurococcales archaeon]
MDINSRLRLVKLDYEVRGVRVLFLKDHPDLPTPGGVVNARRGDEMTLPRLAFTTPPGVGRSGWSFRNST